MTPLHEALRDILARKACELFADYGVACSKKSASAGADRRLCGILGFTGDRLCGSVVISATAEAVADSNPIRDGATRGWVAELTNQLVGRFKNALLRAGVEVAMSIPVVLSAAQLTPLPQTASDPIELDVGNGHLAIWLEVEADPTLVLTEPDPGSEVAAEGEAMLF
jgi:CheY-specific phosphatase CheX